VKNSIFYTKILKEYKQNDFWSPAEEIIFRTGMDKKVDNVLLNTTAKVTAPVLLSYVLWVLEDARKRGIKRLFFLARDGYVLFQMASIICQAWKYDIECRYFYGSRYAFRLPLFVIDKEYALNQLCLPSISVITMGSLLARAGIKGEEAVLIAKEFEIHIDTVLDKSALGPLHKKLAESEKFNRLATEIAHNALKEIKGYFVQECNEPGPFVLVDSGWKGSLQTSFLKIYQAVFNREVKVSGYYFGMLSNPDRQYGNFSCFLFHPQKSFWRIVFFNNNLFECMCSADHGMTIGYKMKNNQWHPCTEEYTNEWDVKSQLEICSEYTKIFVQYNNQSDNTKGLDKFVFRLLKKFMYNPSKEEASLYGRVRFSADVTTKNSTNLAGSLTITNYLEFSFIKMIIKNRLGKSLILWPAGSVPLSNGALCRALMKADFFIYNLLRYVYLYLKNNILAYFFNDAICNKSKNFEKLFRKFEANIDWFDIISFDVFDTLISRKVNNPADIFSLVEKKTGKKGFAKKRIMAEYFARKKKKDSEDVSFDDIYNELKDRNIEFLKQSEINEELNSCYRNKNGYRLYELACKKDKIIIVVSDMYLPSHIISSILFNAGYSNVGKIFVSNEYRKCKWTGHLFSAVLDELKIDNEKIMHIGDNYNADVIGAKKAGIIGLHFPSRNCRKIKSFLFWILQFSKLNQVFCSLKDL
jgi:HAD superfamily hydrolase (TIGR01549 family)